GLDDNTAKVFSKRLDNVLISRNIWDDLVNEGVIRESKIKELKLIVELAELTNNNIELVKTFKSKTPSKLGNNFSTIRDLTVLDRNDWLSFIEDNNIIPPKEVDSQNYARQLSWSVERRYPSAVFAHRTIFRDRGKVS